MKRIVLIALLFAASLSARAQPSEPADQVSLQAVGNVPGYASQVYISNVSPDPISVTIDFTPVNVSAADWGHNQPFPRRSCCIELAAGQKSYMVDLGAAGISGFGMAAFSACLSGADCRGDYSSRRQYYRSINIESVIVAGHNAETFPAVPWYGYTSSADCCGMDHVFVTGIRENDRFRTNLLYANVSQFSSTCITATLFSGTGIQYGDFQECLGPSENRQRLVTDMFPAAFTANRLMRLPAITNAYVVFRQTSSVPMKDAPADWRPAFLAAGSMVDRLTGDSSTLKPQYEVADISRDGVAFGAAQRPVTLFAAAKPSRLIAASKALRTCDEVCEIWKRRRGPVAPAKEVK